MGLEWQGLAQARFSRYAGWVNSRKPGICGTYCTAVLAHDRVLTDTGVDLERQRLIAGLYPLVDAWRPYPGSFIWDIVIGLATLFKDQPYQVRAGLAADVQLPRLLDAGFGPFVVGVVGPLGSDYGNHWVLVYQYARNDAGQLLFRCYDNHGKSDAVIGAVESLAYAYLRPLPQPGAGRRRLD